ncbi:MAG: hypothetical protein Kow0042_04660 [Calditrichia bacterium]
MKNQMALRSKLLVLAIIAILVLIQACEKSETTMPEENSPEIPPASSFIMDFSDFSSSDTSNLSLGFYKEPGENLSYRNWWWAAINVGVWNTILTVTLIVPTAAFLESFNHTPVQQPDGSWLWTYNFTAAGVVHTAKLRGSINNNGTTWEMRITKPGFYQDFLWYTGQANLFLTNGSWALNKDPNEPEPFLDIQWNRNPQDSTADIKYINVIPGHPDSSGYIFYGVTTDTTFDAFYDIYSKSHNNTINIQWNRISKAGRVKDPLHFGDPDWHCWDEQLLDTICP